MKTVNILLILLLLSACKKEDDKITTIEGQLMASCDVPAANTSGFILTNDGLLSGPGISLSFTTDENGHFKVSHRGKADQLNSFTVRVQGSSDVLKVPGLPGDEKNLGKIYINPFPTNFIIKLDVRNAYSENDTLVMTDYTSSNPFDNILIPGPFTSGVLDTVFNHMHTMFPIRLSEVINHGGPQNAIGYLMRSAPSYIGTPKKFNFYIAPICSGEFAEAIMIID
jgi:hypothetical protein